MYRSRFDNAACAKVALAMFRGAQDMLSDLVMTGRKHLIECVELALSVGGSELVVAWLLRVNDGIVR